MLFRRRHGWVGMYVLPSAIFNFLLPVVFVPILLIVALENILSGNILSLVVFFFATIAIQTATATVGIILAGERFSLLWAVPMTRLMYSPMKTWLMYRTVINGLRGVAVGWNKLQRTGTVQYRQTAKRTARLPQAKPIEQEEVVQA
jgi:biofilm PGA synthesis N-glycosyltransferase PgaC